MTGIGIETSQIRDWDASVEALGGDLLQRWNWGEFKSRYGWEVERVRTAEGSHAQILFRHRGPISIGYLPRGPVLSDDHMGNLELLHEIDAACVRHCAVTLIVEPTEPLPDAWMRHGAGFTETPDSIQSPRTVIVDLTLDDDALLRQMRKDTRYNISYAVRHGMHVERAEFTRESIDGFFRLLHESATRGDFGIHDRRYYEDFLHLFGNRSVLLFSRVNGTITAGLIASRSGTAARSMYAGMANHSKTRGDAALLRFSAMQWAREHGCTTYDLGGIAPLDPSIIRDGSRHPKASAVVGLAGVEKFKTGFGGQIVTFPQTVERIYHPRLSWLARSFQKWLPRNLD